MSHDQWEPNPPYGEKGGYRKLTVTLPPFVYERLIQESARRKIKGEPNQALSALIREALSRYLDQVELRHDDIPTGEAEAETVVSES